MGVKFSEGVLEVLDDAGLDVDLIVTIAPFQDWSINYGDTDVMHFVNKEAVSGDSTNPEGNISIKTNGRYHGEVGKAPFKINRPFENHYLSSFYWIFDKIPQVRDNWRKNEPRVNIEVGNLEIDCVGQGCN